MSAPVIFSRLVNGAILVVAPFFYFPANDLFALR